MISAAKALEKSKQCVEQLVKEELEKIEEKIVVASAKGQTYINLSFISEEAEESLKNLGYVVNVNRGNFALGHRVVIVWGNEVGGATDVQVSA